MQAANIYVIIQIYSFNFIVSRYSFIDLAQIVCKLPETRFENAYSSSSDEDFDGYISEPNMMVSINFLYIIVGQLASPYKKQ